MLKIRLQRIGRRHDPQFRVVVIDGRRGPKSGKFIEIVGNYNAKAGEVNLEGDRIKYWIGVGAQPSDTVHNFCVSQGIIEGKKINALPKKTAPVPEPVEEEPAAEAPAQEATEETPAEETTQEEAAEAPAEEAAAEEAPAEEAAPADDEAETPAEETPAEADDAPEASEEEKTEA